MTNATVGKAIGEAAALAMRLKPPTSQGEALALLDAVCGPGADVPTRSLRTGTTTRTRTGRHWGG